jgi:hypothetical protein
MRTSKGLILPQKNGEFGKLQIFSWATGSVNESSPSAMDKNPGNADVLKKTNFLS